MVSFITYQLDDDVPMLLRYVYSKYPSTRLTRLSSSTNTASFDDDLATDYSEKCVYSSQVDIH
jgi:hypothetical protein